MIHHNNNGQEYLMVDKVPVDARGFCKAEDGTILYLHGQGMMNMCSKINVPFDDYEVLFHASQATEEQAGEVVERVHSTQTGKFIYRKYASLELELSDNVYCFTNPKDSLSSLLSSQNMEGETLFLKRVK